jgi:hypothetical protein
MLENYTKEESKVVNEVSLSIFDDIEREMMRRGIVVLNDIYIDNNYTNESNYIDVGIDKTEVETIDIDGVFEFYNDSTFNFIRNIDIVIEDDFIENVSVGVFSDLFFAEKINLEKKIKREINNLLEKDQIRVKELNIELNETINRNLNIRKMII